mmetsp:Transcript_1054/g.1064  ORF Transcript_1054/g.1064 Transcript_1054/m.1064 type:complete len:125 (-) Transcript_1054:111-485(-)
MFVRSLRSFQINSRRFIGSKVIIPGDQNTFEKIVAKGGKAVFYYTATWCPPCRAIAPVFEQLSQDYPDISFTKIDVDQLPAAASSASIRSVPTFIFKNNGNTVAEFSGADSKRLESTLASLNKL